MASSRVDRLPFGRADTHPVRRRIARARGRLRRLRRRLAAVPQAARLATVLATALVIFAAVNLAYQVVREPIDLFAPLSGTLEKTPAGTWRDYGPLFRRYATRTVPPALLAALAQVESDGNPLASSYWRWQFAWNPFAVYAPASSSIGLYQMTDAAYAEARRYCIHDHAVVAAGCWFNDLYARMLPGDAVELTAVLLDRTVAIIRADQPKLRADPRQLWDLAAVAQLCGVGPAEDFARRHFRLARGARCGDVVVADYLARVRAMQRLFRKLAAAR
jgi:hypothetical protein